MVRGPNGAVAPILPLSPVPDLFAHQPPPRGDGRLPVTVTHLEMLPTEWTRRALRPTVEPTIVRSISPPVALYRDLYDRVGRPWLWYERRLMPDTELRRLLSLPGHELHTARHGENLVGFFELHDEELVFFGLTLEFVGRRIGPWLLDKAIERAFALGWKRLRLNTNTVDHPRALDTYRKAGFRVVRSEHKELQDPRVLWPELYRWPPT